PPPSFDGPALSTLAGYTWPGNVRELKNAVEHAVVMSDGRTVHAQDLPEKVRGLADSNGAIAAARGATGGALPAALADVERERIERALEEEGGNQTRAATRLGI